MYLRCHIEYTCHQCNMYPIIITWQHGGFVI